MLMSPFMNSNFAKCELKGNFPIRIYIKYNPIYIFQTPEANLCCIDS